MIVILVLKEELWTPTITVFVMSANTSMLLLHIVKIVTMPVTNVPPTTSVLNVLVPTPEMTQLTPTNFVTVSLNTTITVMMIVTLVPINVTSVKTLQPTVLFVLKEESTHQNVTFHHKKSEPPELKISQSVPLKSFYVTVTV